MYALLPRNEGLREKVSTLGASLSQKTRFVAIQDKQHRVVEKKQELAISRALMPPSIALLVQNGHRYRKP